MKYKVYTAYRVKASGAQLWQAAPRRCVAARLELIELIHWSVVEADEAGLRAVPGVGRRRTGLTRRLITRLQVAGWCVQVVVVVLVCEYHKIRNLGEKERRRQRLWCW